MLIQLDHKAREARVSQRASDVLQQLRKRRHGQEFDVEAYNFMLESQPQ